MHPRNHNRTLVVTFSAELPNNLSPAVSSAIWDQQQLVLHPTTLAASLEERMLPIKQQVAHCSAGVNLSRILQQRPYSALRLSRINSRHKHLQPPSVTAALLEISRSSRASILPLYRHQVLLPPPCLPARNRRVLPFTLRIAAIHLISRVHHYRKATDCRTADTVPLQAQCQVWLGRLATMESAYSETVSVSRLVKVRR